MKVFVLIVLCSLLVSCHKLTSGTVTEMWYEPQNEYLYMMPVYTSNGKTTFTTFIPMWITDNEDYVVIIKGIYKGDLREEKYFVTPQCYNRLSVGSTMFVGDDCSLEDSNNLKERK